MTRLELNSSEEQLLSEILNGELTNLNLEIAKTDDFDFRNQLKNRRDTVLSLLASINQQSPPSKSGESERIRTSDSQSY